MALGVQGFAPGHGSGGVRCKRSSDVCSEGTKVHQHRYCFEFLVECLHWRLQLQAASVLLIQYAADDAMSAQEI